jgi:hypothetical protein
MRRLFIIFCLTKFSLFSQVDKSKAFIYIELQGKDNVYHQYYLFHDKDTIKYLVEQSDNDFEKKAKIDPKASQKIIDKAVYLIEKIKIDSTKELDLYSSHFIRITVSYNQQQKTVFIRDKYYYLFLENIFNSINNAVSPSFKLPLKSITFSKKIFTPSDKTNHNSFTADWRYSFYSDHPKNRTLYYNSNYKDSLSITIGANKSKKEPVQKVTLDSLRILTLACINDFKFKTDIATKPTDYEFFEVYHYTKRVEIMTTFRSFNLANKNQRFVDLRNFINSQILPTNKLD